jgi:hypothetical protein
MADQLIFDQGASDALDVMADPYAITAMSSPMAPLELATAGSIDTEGDLIAARRHQNRTVNLTVEVRGTSQSNVETLLAALQRKVAKIARQGGTLTRITSASTTRILDLLAADTYEPAFDVQYFNGHWATVTVGLMARPYARGPQVTLTSMTKGTTTSALTFTQTALAGDVPATGSLVLHELDSVSRRSVVWGVQATNSPQPLVLEAEGLTLGSGASTVITDAAASSGQAVTNAMTTLPAVLTIDPSGGGIRSHIGNYRVMARIRASSSADVDLQFAWASGYPSVLAGLTATIPAAYANNNYRLVDFGVINIAERVVGNQRWRGELFAFKNTGSTSSVTVDCLYLVPLDGSAAELRDGLYQDHATEIRSDGIFWSGQGGSSDYAAADFEGDLLSLPVGADLNFIVIPSAGYVLRAPYDTEATTRDTGKNDISAQLFYTPRYLTVF